MPGVPLHAFDNLKAKLKAAFKKEKKPADSAAPAEPTKTADVPVTKTDEAAPAAVPAATAPVPVVEEPKTVTDAPKDAPAPAAATGTEDPAAKAYPSPDEVAASSSAAAPAEAPAVAPAAAPAAAPVVPEATAVPEVKKEDEPKPAAAV